MRTIILGGRHAINYRIGVLFVPFLILSIPLTEDNISKQIFLRWTVVSTISLLLSVFFLVILDKTLLADRIENPISNNALFSLGLGLGAFRGAITFTCARMIYHIPSETLGVGFIRIINGSLIGCIAVPFTALISFSYYEISKATAQHHAILTSIEQLKDAKNIAPIRIRLVEEVSHRLDKSRNEILKLSQKKNLPQNSQIAREIRDLANNLVRPLSHRVVTATTNHQKLFKDSLALMLLIPDSIARQWPWMVSLYSATQIRSDISGFGIAKGLILFALNTTSFMALIALLVWTYKHTRPAVNYVFLFSVIAGLLNALCCLGAYRLLNGILDLKSFILIALWTIFLISMVPFSGAYLMTSLQSLDKIQSRYFTEYRNITTHIYSHNASLDKLARFLHGSLQTKLNSSAFRIYNLKTEGQVRKELEIITSYLILPDSITSVESQIPIRDRLETIKDLWSPLIDVLISERSIDSCPDSIALDQLCEVVSEAISNACRHGAATAITFTIEYKADSISLEASNDGQLVHSFTGGFGAMIYDKATNKNWQLINKNQKATLVAEIPAAGKEL